MPRGNSQTPEWVSTLSGLFINPPVECWPVALCSLARPVEERIEKDQKQLAAGCTAFLTKPIKQEVLLQAIREHSIVAPALSKEKSSQMDPILLRVNPKFANRIPAYLQSCRQNAIVMLDALDRDDFETVKILGHQMSGSGGMFGFQAITDIGGSLEQAAESADTDASRKWVGELSDYLDGIDTISHQPVTQ